MMRVLKAIFYVISICFYVLAGLFIHIINMVAFCTFPTNWLYAKYIIMVTLSVIGLALLFLAIVNNGFKNCQRFVGITMVSAGLSSVLMAISKICVLQSSEMMKEFPIEILPYLKLDYLTGGLTTAATLLAGTLLTKYAKKDAALDDEADDAP